MVVSSFGDALRRRLRPTLQDAGCSAAAITQASLARETVEERAFIELAERLAVSRSVFI
jgi:hypothetical protein